METVMTCSIGQIRIREIKETDYNLGFMDCLSYLTKTGNVGYPEFKERLELIRSKGDYTILVAIYDNKIVGSGTLFIEYKFIRDLAHKGHIEDIVVRKDFQGHGIGKKIVEKLVEISVDKKCYKTSLCTSTSTAPFYMKCKFEEKGSELAIYHKNE